MPNRFFVGDGWIYQESSHGRVPLFEHSALPHGFLSGLQAGRNSLDPNELRDALAAELLGASICEAYRGGRIFFTEQQTHLPDIELGGTLIVGPECDIRAGSAFRGTVVLVGGNVVGHNVELKDALLLNGAKVAHLTYVGNSVVGQGTILGAGVVCANRRLDGQISDPFGRGTAAPFVGSLIGDQSVVGANCVINPGAVVRAKSQILPLTSVLGRWL